MTNLRLLVAAGAVTLLTTSCSAVVDAYGRAAETWLRTGEEPVDADLDDPPSPRPEAGWGTGSTGTAGMAARRRDDHLA